MLWNDLVQKNYINKKGFITDNFALLTNYDQLDLNKNFITIIKEDKK